MADSAFITELPSMTSITHLPSASSSYSFPDTSTFASAIPDSIDNINDTTVLVLSNMAMNVQQKLPAIIISSLTLIAGLAWNAAFTAIMNYYIPENVRQQYSAWVKLLYAFVFTIIVVIVISIILYFAPTTKLPPSLKIQ